jgi:hypothetical protein
MSADSNPIADAIAASALALRDGVDPEQRAKLCLPFADEAERRNWFYWPAPRQGLALGDLDGSRRQLVHALLTVLLTTPALAKVTTIMGLEVVLADLEGDGLSRRRRPDGLPRDPSAYATTIFGDPAAGAPWGVRFEGHHVSVHTTVVDGKVAATPLFLGSNPAQVEHHRRVVLRPLGEEEDVARALLAALPAAARRRAVIDDTAPADIITTNAPRVAHELGGGVALADLSGEAAELAAALVALHVDRTRAAPPTPIGVPADLHFAWAGDAERGRPHYYRIHCARFLVEYDNTQNDANHAHSVWRDPAGDFGDDLLRAHHAAEHSHNETT